MDGVGIRSGLGKSWGLTPKKITKKFKTVTQKIQKDIQLSPERIELSPRVVEIVTQFSTCHPLFCHPKDDILLLL